MSSVNSMLLVSPLTVTDTLPCDVLPVMSDNLDEPVILALPSFTVPPVR